MRGETYRLTDPCICSEKEGTYGATDLGFQGIHSFFSNHKCNDYCSNTWLSPAHKMPQLQLNAVKQSTYVHQLSKTKVNLNNYDIQKASVAIPTKYLKLLNLSN